MGKVKVLVLWMQWWTSKGHRGISALRKTDVFVKGQEALAFKIDDKFMCNEKKSVGPTDNRANKIRGIKLVCVHIIGPNFQSDVYGLCLDGSFISCRQWCERWTGLERLSSVSIITWKRFGTRNAGRKHVQRPALTFPLDDVPWLLALESLLYKVVARLAAAGIWCKSLVFRTKLMGHVGFVGRFCS